jgi:endonuclease/exonuclease/phosphatase family metal-dependent hydrolase
MSFNLRVSTFIDGLNHWTFRRELLLSMIQQFNPDLLGTQEGLASQLDWLRERMPQYQFVGAGRNDGKRKGEMCGIFFRSDKYELIDEGHFWLSKTPHKPGSRSWGSAFPRMATWVKLRPRNGGQTYVFLNTHFDNIGSRARLESAYLVRDRLASIAGGMPVVITGDFNTDENTAPYTALLGARELGLRFVDTFRAANPQPQQGEGTRHGFRGSRRGDRIDWILTSTAFHTVWAEIDRTRRGVRYPSDHFPVTAIVRPLAPPAIAHIE